MALTDFLSDLNIGGGNFLGATGTLLTGLIIIIFIAIAVGLFTFFFAQKRAYSKRIIIWRNVGGSAQIVDEDKAREINLPNTSTRALQLKRNKFILPRPSIEVKKDLIFYFIRNDGEWLNIGIQDLDVALLKLNLRFDHSDMRMANASLKKLVEKNYRKLSFLKEYAPYIGFAVIILMISIGAFLFFREASVVVGGLAEAGKQLAEVIETEKEILQSLDNMLSTSGARTV